MQSSQNWITRLNVALAGEVEIYCQTPREPVLHLEGEYQLTALQKKGAVKQRETLKRDGRPNDMHAIVIEEPAWQATPVHMRLQMIDYAGVVALRNEGACPPVLSSAALILSHVSRQIFIHRRGANVARYYSHLHTIGGGYMPPSHQGRGDRTSLRATIEREVLEETGLILPAEAAPPMILAKEVATGSIQLAYLGFDVSAPAISQVDGNWEGLVEAVPYAALPGLLQQPDWVPSGKAHVLAWLALGAPDCGEKPQFGGLSPDELFDTCVDA